MTPFYEEEILTKLIVTVRNMQVFPAVEQAGRNTCILWYWTYIKFWRALSLGVGVHAPCALVLPLLLVNRYLYVYLAEYNLFKVFLHGYSFSPVPVTSGDPQGSSSLHHCIGLRGYLSICGTRQSIWTC